MPACKILITDYAWPDLEIERQRLSQIGAELVIADRQDATSLARQAADVDAIMTCWARVPAEVITSAPRLRIVARFGIGLDNIDVESCTQHQIVVTNVPDYCQIEVAEHTFALLLSLARRTAFFHHQTKQGRYDLSSAEPIFRVTGRTLGIVGLGNIGRAVAERAQAFGLKVIATRRSPGNQMAGVRFVALPDLLAQSDFVSLHLPLTENTKHIIGGRQLATMKSTAYLINTARGDLIDHRALAGALCRNELAGAALDVQSPEPPDLTTPPYNHPRVIVTPHAAFVSAESLLDLRSRVANQVATLLSGGIPENVVNPEVLAGP